MSDRADPSTARRLSGLRANSLAATVMLVIEFGIGMWVNLYASLQPAELGSNLATGFAHAIASGPVGLSIHAILGVLLIVSATIAVIRAALARRRVLIAVTAVGLAAMVFAALGGARFIGDRAADTSMSMAAGTGVAILCYALVLFITPAGGSVEAVS